MIGNSKTWTRLLLFFCLIIAVALLVLRQTSVRADVNHGSMKQGTVQLQNRGGSDGALPYVSGETQNTRKMQK